MNKTEAFLKEYKELIDKHGVDFANYPVYIPDGEGSFKLVIQSTPVDLEEMKKAQDEMAKKTLKDFIPE